MIFLSKFPPFCKVREQCSLFPAFLLKRRIFLFSGVSCFSGVPVFRRSPSFRRSCWKTIVDVNWFCEPNMSYFNLLDFADFLMHACITLVSRFVWWCGNPGCPLIQPHTCACNMCIISSFVVNWQFRRIDRIGSHKLASYLPCPPCSCTYNSHIVKNVSFLAYFKRIFNSCLV